MEAPPSWAESFCDESPSQTLSTARRRRGYGVCSTSPGLNGATCLDTTLDRGAERFGEADAVSERTAHGDNVRLRHKNCDNEEGPRCGQPRSHQLSRNKDEGIERARLVQWPKRSVGTVNRAGTHSASSTPAERQPTATKAIAPDAGAAFDESRRPVASLWVARLVVGQAGDLCQGKGTD